jgi:LPS-assembly lipoprotein
MSWRRTVWIVLTAAGLAGCGFHPLYAENDGKGPLEPRLATVRVAQITERDGQQMTNMLRDAFNPHAISVPAAYQLEISLVKRKFDVLRHSDATSSRNDTELTAKWTLRRLSDNKTVLTGTSTSLNSHDVLTNDYANVVSQQGDLDDGVRMVSEDIENRVVAWLQTST